MSCVVVNWHGAHWIHFWWWNQFIFWIDVLLPCPVFSRVHPMFTEGAVFLLKHQACWLVPEYRFQLSRRNCLLLLGASWTSALLSTEKCPSTRFSVSWFQPQSNCIRIHHCRLYGEITPDCGSHASKSQVDSIVMKMRYPKPSSRIGWRQSPYQ